MFQWHEGQSGLDIRHRPDLTTQPAPLSASHLPLTPQPYHTIAFSGQWDCLGCHGDRTNRETSCSECFLHPCSSNLTFRHFRLYVCHANLLYLHVCGGECLFVCLGVLKVIISTLTTPVLTFQAVGKGNWCIMLRSAEGSCQFDREIIIALSWASMIFIHQ